MQFFRKLAKTVIFKIILAFVALSFVLFGVSSFILGSPNSWVAKVGGDPISYSQFNAALKADRDIILASGQNNNEQVMHYLESDAFKSDVLGRLVNQVMVKKLADDFDVIPSKKIILESIARDTSFKDESGKFDRKKFEAFLKKNGLNEERYVQEISNSVAATMILQSFSMSSPVSDEFIRRFEEFNAEKRVADVVTISSKDVGDLGKPSDEELQKFFADNQEKYVQPERRKVSYVTFSKKDFAGDLKISDQEVFAEYEKNKEQYTTQEKRSLYNVVFDKEEDAKNFLQKLSASKGSKDEFAKLAKELAKKDLKTITLSKVSKKDLFPQIAEPIFKLALNQHSEVVQSPFGFHVFLLNEIKEPQLVPFSEVKDGIKKQMAEGREDKIVQEKISAIDDLLLTSNSLSEVAKKFHIKSSSQPILLDANGRNEKGDATSIAKDFPDFAGNAFALKEKQVSKIFFNQNSGEFYAIAVDEVVPSKQLTLEEVKGAVTSDLLVAKKKDALRELALKVNEEIKNNPDSAAKIAAKYHVKFEKSREFPRVIYVSFQGQQMPYQDHFLKDLFTLQVNEVTPIAEQADDQFAIGILREIKKSVVDSVAVVQARRVAKEEFVNEVMQEYNVYLLARYPVATNDKFFGKKEE